MRLTNWYTHPADNRYHVFEFRDMEMGEEFERDLTQAGIAFEKAPSRAHEEWRWGVASIWRAQVCL